MELKLYNYDKWVKLYWPCGFTAVMRPNCRDGNMENSILGPDAALDELRKRRGEFERLYGVTKIGIFGSLARGEAREDSDVDVVVEMRKPNLFYVVHIKETLEEDFQRHVDIVRYRKTMNPYLKARIDKEARYV